MRSAATTGVAAALVLVTAGCASGPRLAGRGHVGETFVVGGKGDPARVLNPGSVSVATNNAMPVLRVEAFKSEERKP